MLGPTARRLTRPCAPRSGSTRSWRRWPRPVDQRAGRGRRFAAQPGEPQRAAAAGLRPTSRRSARRRSSASARSSRPRWDAEQHCRVGLDLDAAAGGHRQRRRRRRQLAADDPGRRRRPDAAAGRPVAEPARQPVPERERAGVRGGQRGLRAGPADRQPAGHPGRADEPRRPHAGRVLPLRPYAIAVGDAAGARPGRPTSRSTRRCRSVAATGSRRCSRARTGCATGSPVRIAGVDVGKVVDIDEGPGNTTVVTMELNDSGRPVHRDATARIRPRVFLEGGFLVELQPGQPERARAARRRHDPAGADADAGAVPPGAQRARRAGAREPAPAASTRWPAAWTTAARRA